MAQSDNIPSEFDDDGNYTGTGINHGDARRSMDINESGCQKGKLILIDGTIKDVESKFEEFNPEELYNFIGCSYVELVMTADGDFMWVDEEGRINGSEINPEASRIYGKGEIYGNAVLF